MTSGGCYQTSRNSSGRLSWLETTLADLELRMRDLAVPEDDEKSNSDTFADRAENYYRKRPQLLTLLQDLYNRYLSLADRYCQALKHQPQPQILTVQSSVDDDYSHTITDQDSDAESSLSFQPFYQISAKPSNSSTTDSVVAELVSRAVDNSLLLHEVEILERHVAESSRKIELQKSLLEVLESERLVLLNENARLGFQAAAMQEDNKGLASEAAFMKRKACELARCVVKIRDDHRVCVLSRKIEDLQRQIYGLEKRNKDCYEQMVRREEEKREVVKEVCFQVEKLKLENERLKEEASRAKYGRVKKSKWWTRVMNLDLMLKCGSKEEVEKCV